MKESSLGYSVTITRKDGTQFFASGVMGRRFFSFKRPPAIAYKNELLANGIKKAKVVKVIVTTETQDQP